MITEQMFVGKRNAPMVTIAEDVAAGAAAHTPAAATGYSISSANFS
jgi:hypothetical protein